MDSPRDRPQTFEVSVTIFTVKLAVKFPCKMNLHTDGKSATNQVTGNSHVFTFNQQLKVKGTIGEEDAQISVYLSTEKGGNILAGIIALPGSVKDQEGQKLNLSLKKCLDAGAFCDLQINRVWIKKEKVEHLAKSTVGGGLHKNQAKKGKFKNVFEIVQTKSQYQGNIIKRKPFQRLGSPMETYRMNEKSGGGEDFREKYGLGKLNFYGEDKIQEDLKQTKTLGGGRFKRQRPSLKKPIVSETENNLKLDVMKFKMKNEELEKNNAEKNRQVKEAKQKILQLQRKLLQRQYMHEEIASKQTSIKILEDRIFNLTSENSSLRENLADQQKQINEMKDNIRFDIFKNKEQYEKKEQGLRHDLGLAKTKISELQMDLSNKGGQLAKAKKYIEELENSSQLKIFEHDQIIQEIKKTNAKQIAQYVKKNTDLEQEIADLLRNLEGSKSQNVNLTENISKKQSHLHSQQAQINGLQTEKAELLIIKSDHLALTKKYAKLEEQQKQEHKQNQKNISMKNKQLQQLQEESSKNISSLDAKLSLANDKVKEGKKKISDLENSLFVEKNQQDKLKKQCQKLQKTITNCNQKIQALEKEIKSNESRYHGLEKDLQEKQNSTVHTQSLFKMEIQHNKETIIRINNELEEIQSKYTTARDQVEVLRSEKARLQNKVQLLEDNNNRNTEYIRQKKQEIQTKETQFKQQVKSLNSTIKQLEESDKNKQKDLNNWQIKQLSYKNQIDKFQKQIKQYENKVQKIEKSLIPKIEGEKNQLIEERNKLKEKLAQSMEENKFITNERAKLQSETNKNTKINSVLNEEKISAMNEINKLKNALAKAEKREETLQNDIKNLNEENKKQTHKYDMLVKENQKNKDVVSELVTTIVQINNKKSRETSLQLSRKRSSVENLISSDFSQVPEHYDIRRMSEIIDAHNKEQQTTIITLEENIRQYRYSIAELEKELAKVSQVSKNNDEKNQQAIERLTQELEIVHEKMLENTNDYEDRITRLQTQINKKEKDIKLNKETINNFKYEVDSLKKKNEIIVVDTETAQSKLLNEIEELSSEIHFHQMTIQNLQQSKKELQEKIFNLEDEISANRQEIVRKDKFIHELSDKFNKVKSQAEYLYNVKKESTEEILSLKEELNAAKEENLKLKELLKEEEDSKLKLQQFTNNVIKQKEVVVKSQIQVSAKVVELQGKMVEQASIIESLEDQVKDKDQNIVNLKTTNKEQIQNIKLIENQLTEEKNKNAQITLKLQEKEKKGHERDAQYKEIQTKYDSLMTKYKKDMNLIKEQFEGYEKDATVNTEQRDRKIQQLQEIITNHEMTISQQSKELSQNQQTIFFQKQKLSLSESNINQLKKQISQYELMISKLDADVKNLNEELSQKQETLFEYSGKIYQLQQKIEQTKTQFPLQLEKFDSEWQNRHDEICEQYEQRIQILEKQRNYLTERLQEEELQKIKLVDEIKEIEDSHEKDLELAQRKEKQLENQKLMKINEKNKEVDKLKEQNNSLSSDLKKQKIQFRKKQEEVKIKEQAIKKLQGKINEVDGVLEESKKNYEVQLNQLRNKEIIMKNYKEEIRTIQWEVQRQAKKVISTFIQRVVACFPEGKEKLVEPIRSFEQSMQTVVNFNI